MLSTPEARNPAPRLPPLEGRALRRRRPRAAGGPVRRATALRPSCARGARAYPIRHLSRGASRGAQTLLHAGLDPAAHAPEMDVLGRDGLVEALREVVHVDEAREDAE